ncbi:MAG: glycoside hydrolase family 32 protein, partial [Bacteroidota bacterium]
MKSISLTFLIGLLVGLSGCTSETGKQDDMIETTSKPAFALEKHRPQFHFSPQEKWMNDPNGMVFYDGEYHLFYQYYPKNTVWGPMHWGHTVSTDLVHWEHLPIALAPDELGYIFSGSAVIDWNNTTGFQTGEHPPMIAIFTHHLAEGEKAGRDDYQVQSIAYSLDKGRSWTKYEGNPVIPNPGLKDFRDPKVFWHDASNAWVMIFAAGNRVRLYRSADLKSWELASEFGADQGSHAGVWECPDLFPLQDEDGKTHWVMIVSLGSGAPNGGSGTMYFIGDFDGHQFTNANPADKVMWIDYGADNYAGVSWADIPAEDGRRIFLGWMSNWAYALLVPTENWRSAMTVARSLHLEKVDEDLIVVSRPVKEMQKIYGPETSFSQIGVGDKWALEQTIPAAGARLRAKLSASDENTRWWIRLQNQKGQYVDIGADGSTASFFVDRQHAGDHAFSDKFANKVHTAPYAATASSQVELLIDVSSVEIFIDGGRLVMTELFFP